MAASNFSGCRLRGFEALPRREFFITTSLLRTNFEANDPLDCPGFLPSREHDAEQGVRGGLVLGRTRAQEQRR